MRKHSWMLTVCLIVCWFAAVPARAQTPSPGAVAAAHELIVTMRSVDFFKTIMPTLMQVSNPRSSKTGRKSSAIMMPSCRCCWKA